MLLWSLWLVTTRDPRVVEEGFAPAVKKSSPMEKELLAYSWVRIETKHLIIGHQVAM